MADQELRDKNNRLLGKIKEVGASLNFAMQIIG